MESIPDDHRITPFIIHQDGDVPHSGPRPLGSSLEAPLARRSATISRDKGASREVELGAAEPLMC